VGFKRRPKQWTKTGWIPARETSVNAVVKAAHVVHNPAADFIIEYENDLMLDERAGARRVRATMTLDIEELD